MVTALAADALHSRLIEIESKFELRGLPLRYRPLKAFKAIYGSVNNEAQRLSLFDPISVWYADKYGPRMNWDGVIGRIPVFLRSQIYLVAVPFQTTEAMIPLAERIEGFPIEPSAALTPEEFNAIGSKIAGSTLSFHSVYNLSVDDCFLTEEESEMIWRALCDLENAASTLKNVGDTQNAVLCAHEAAEKFLKVALIRSGSRVKPKTLQHDIQKVIDELVKTSSRYGWLKSSVEALQSAAPNMQIRYGLVPRSIPEAIAAFNAALNICGALSQMWLFDIKRGSEKSSFSPGRFYTNGSGVFFLCQKVFQDQNTSKNLAVLTPFLSLPEVGTSLMCEIRLGSEQSALYLELSEPGEIQAARRILSSCLERRADPATPPSVKVNVADGAEGSYTTISLRIKKPNQDDV